MLKQAEGIIFMKTFIEKKTSWYEEDGKVSAKNTTTTKTNIYTYDELDEQAKAKVKEELNNQLVDDNFMFFTEDIINKLQDEYKLEVESSSINYSLNYCQGDGLCFTMDNLLSYTRLSQYQKDNNKDELNAFEKWLVENLQEDELSDIIEYLNDGYNFKIIRKSHHYCHAYTCVIDYEYFYSCDDGDIQDRINNLCDMVCDKLFKEVYTKICGELESYGYQRYDITEEDIKDYVNANEFLFKQDGSIF